MSTEFNYRDLSLSWDEINKCAQELAVKLKRAEPWQGIVAVTRGGLIPACIVARRLGVARVETFCISSYNDQQQKEAVIISQPDIADGGRGWLVVDDLIDSGKTLKIIRQTLPHAEYAVLFAKQREKAGVDHYVRAIDDDVWIHFPWEDNEASYVAPKR